MNQRPVADHGPGPFEGPNSYPYLCWWSLILRLSDLKSCGPQKMVELLLEFSRVGKYDAMNTQPLGSFDMASGIVNKHGLVGWSPNFGMK
jgi:hypothetical protein